MDPLSMQPLSLPATAQARAEFYLCLARAFAVPTAPDLFGAMRDALAADLRAIAGDAGDLDGAATETFDGALTAYESAIAAIPDQPALLRLYSRLFLVPGDAHPSLDTGIYLDGAPEGRSVGAMASWYDRCGLAPSLASTSGSAPSARPDHLSVQLAFVAWLFEAAVAPGTDPAGASDASIGGPLPSGEPSPVGAPPVTAPAFLRAFVGHRTNPDLRFGEQAGAAEVRGYDRANLSFVPEVSKSRV